MKTTIENIKKLDVCYQDMYSISYYAIDTLKNKPCILTYSKVPTSWDYSVDYI